MRVLLLWKSANCRSTNRYAHSGGKIRGGGGLCAPTTDRYTRSAHTNRDAVADGDAHTNGHADGNRYTHTYLHADRDCNGNLDTLAHHATGKQ